MDSQTSRWMVLKGDVAMGEFLMWVWFIVLLVIPFVALYLLFKHSYLITWRDVAFFGLGCFLVATPLLYRIHQVGAY